VLYNKDVRAELKKLRGASQEQLRLYDDERREKRIAWYKMQRWPSTFPDPLEAAYHVLLQKMGIQESEAPIVHKDATKIVFHSRNFCPTLEACKILGLDTREVCRLYNEKSTDALVKQVDRRLAFSRNYRKMRPLCDFCEESICW
jgi:tRNA(adenine34) deaminase